MGSNMKQPIRTIPQIPSKDDHSLHGIFGFSDLETPKPNSGSGGGGTFCGAS